MRCGMRLGMFTLRSTRDLSRGSRVSLTRMVVIGQPCRADGYRLYR